MTKYSNYTVCYEAIQRRYRNRVIRHVRDNLREAHPNDWLDRIQHLFTDAEWSQIRTNAMLPRLTGQLQNAVVDDLDLLGVSHFHNIFEKYFDRLVPAGNDVNPETRRREKQVFLGWVKEVRDLRDPTSHPPEADLPYADAFREIDSAARVLGKFDATASKELRQLSEELVSDAFLGLTEVGGLPGSSINAPGEALDESDEIREPLDGYLPSAESITVRFVGRDTELSTLRTWFADTRAHLWALMGDGGKGKTTIAYEFACETKESRPEGYDFVLWMSAKRRRFLEGAAVDVAEPDFDDLGSALRWILQHYGWWSDFEDSPLEEQEDWCLQLLNEFPSLIVVDDADSLEGESESAIRFFVQKAASTKSKILFTSRRALLGLGDITTVVAGLKGREGQDFIRTRIALLALDPDAFPAAIFAAILESTDGSPLFIEDLLRLCASGLSPHEAVQKWRDEKGGDAARRYALQREFDMLSDRAKDILVAAAVAPGPLSLAEIQVMAGATSEDCQSAIQELQRLFLVPKPRLIESVERFDLNLNTRALVRSVMAGSDRLRRLEGAYQALTGEYTSPMMRRAKIGAFVRQAVGLVKQDRHAEAEGTLEIGLQTYPEDPTLLGQLGWVYRMWKPAPRYADARSKFERAAELNCQDEEMFRHWAEMEYGLGEFSRAASAAELGLTRLRDSRPLRFCTGISRSRRGKELAQELQPRAAEEFLRAKVHLDRALVDPEQMADYKERRLQARVLRALALTLGNLMPYCDDYPLRIDTGEEQTRLTLPARVNCARQGREIIARWQAEHPDDTLAVTEGHRLAPKFAELPNPRSSLD
jgi:hypothetical protein